VEEIRLGSGKRVFFLGEGRLINLAAAEGHPASVMDMSFANQALSAEYIARQETKLPVAVHPVPEDIDREIARLKLASIGSPSSVDGGAGGVPGRLMRDLGAFID
jgi:adenosylhomocysteinase